MTPAIARKAGRVDAPLVEGQPFHGIDPEGPGREGVVPHGAVRRIIRADEDPAVRFGRGPKRLDPRRPPCARVEKKEDGPLPSRVERGRQIKGVALAGLPKTDDPLDELPLFEFLCRDKAEGQSTLRLPGMNAGA